MLNLAVSAPTSSWPTSPSPPLPSDSQGVFPAHRHSSVGHVDWNSVGQHMTGGGHGNPTSSPSLSAHVSEDGRKISMDSERSRAQTLGRSSSGKSDGEGKSGVRSFFGRNKRSTMPAQPREGGPSGIPVPVKKSEMTRSQSQRDVVAGSGRQDESREFIDPLLISRWHLCIRRAWQITVADLRCSCSFSLFI